jgi:hypothetical protein
VIKLRPRQVRYKVAKDGVVIGEHAKSELLQLYFDQKIKLSDYLWRDGLTEWQTLYDLYTEFLETPEQLRAHDRDVQMTTKTSYRIKYLTEKSSTYIKQKRKSPNLFKREQASLSRKIAALRQKVASEQDADKWDDLNSQLIEAEGMLGINECSHEGRDEEYIDSIADETKDEIAVLRKTRVAFWCLTFEKDPPNLNKKELKILTESYETRVSQILRGLVPWSTIYFELGSIFSMPSTRALYEAHGKNYIRPTEAEINKILKTLDEQNPDWDEKTPEIFYSNLKPSIPHA